MVQLHNIYRWSIIVALAASVAVASSCVSSETARRSDDNPAQEMADDAGEGESGGSVYVDTISPLPYEVFEQVVNSEDPKKLTVRMMMLREGSWEALSRTLRLALDSLTSADSSLVAARVTFYEIMPVDNTRGNLVARAWGEWIPREGWDKARSGSDVLHRSYIYHTNPGWTSISDEQ